MSQATADENLAIKNMQKLERPIPLKEVAERALLGKGTSYDLATTKFATRNIRALARKKGNCLQMIILTDSTSKRPRYGLYLSNIEEYFLKLRKQLEDSRKG